ncbi:MAG: ankyrin repeat domain-containing protein, partial [Peptostreptococcaceae bacterium]
KILIRNKANANIKDCFGNVALFYAIKTNNQAVVDFLTDNTDLTLVNNKQENALLKSIKFNYHDVEKFEDGNIHYNHINDSILHYAVKYNNLKLVKKYANRFLINQKNNNDESVFFYAVKFGNRDIVRELLQYLPVVDITNKYSENLIDVSVNNHYEISDLIENYLSSLDFIYYKKNHFHIYKYLCDNIIDKAITNKILNKKDNFSLSLIDYLNFYEDKPNLKMLDKNKNNRN